MQQYKPGDVVSGYRLDAEGAAWEQVVPSYQPGDIVAGCRLSGDGTRWEPLANRHDGPGTPAGEGLPPWLSDWQRAIEERVRKWEPVARENLRAVKSRTYDRNPRLTFVGVFAAISGLVLLLASFGGSAGSGFDEGPKLSPGAEQFVDKYSAWIDEDTCSAYNSVNRALLLSDLTVGVIYNGDRIGTDDIAEAFEAYCS